MSSSKTPSSSNSKMAQKPAQMPAQMPEMAPSLVYFDGVCGLCNQFVDWLIEKGTPAQHLLFTPLQGETARRHLDPASIQDLSSVVFTRESQIFRKSTAILMIAKDFRGAEYLPFRLLASAALILPAPFRDACYDWVARHRYQFFGKKATCRIPAPDERKRFLP